MFSVWGSSSSLEKPCNNSILDYPHKFLTARSLGLVQEGTNKRGLSVPWWLSLPSVSLIGSLSSMCVCRCFWRHVLVPYVPNWISRGGTNPRLFGVATPDTISPLSSFDWWFCLRYLLVVSSLVAAIYWCHRHSVLVVTLLVVTTTNFISSQHHKWEYHHPFVIIINLYCFLTDRVSRLPRRVGCIHSSHSSCLRRLVSVSLRSVR